MTDEEVQELAKNGARAEISNLEARLTSLRAFVGDETEEKPHQREQVAPIIQPVSPRSRRPMTEAEKRALSRRMKLFWKQRKEAATTK